jgi:hypothetical protein
MAGVGLAGTSSEGYLVLFINPASKARFIGIDAGETCVAVFTFSLGVL